MVTSDSLLLLALILLILLLAAISIVDIRTLRIPNSLNLGLALLGIGFSGLIHQSLPVASVVGAVLLVSLFLAVRELYRRGRGIEGLGLGDVKMAGASALWLQPANIPVFLFFSSVSALLYLLFFRRSNSHYQFSGRIPFGPFLAVGLLICWALESFTEIQLLV